MNTRIASALLVWLFYGQSSLVAQQPKEQPSSVLPVTVRIVNHPEVTLPWDEKLTAISALLKYNSAGLWFLRYAYVVRASLRMEVDIRQAFDDPSCNLKLQPGDLVEAGYFDRNLDHRFIHARKKPLELTPNEGRATEQ